MPTRVRIADPSWVNKGTSAREARLGQEALIARGGVFPITPHPVGPGGGMVSRIQPCALAIPRSGQGAYLTRVETAVNLDHDVADATNPRIDRIVARVYDTEIAGDSIPSDVLPGTTQTGVAVLEIVKGTAAGSPVAPALPTGAALVMDVRIPANTATLTQANAYTPGTKGLWAFLQGGPAIVRSSTERDALNKYPGFLVYREDLGTYEYTTDGTNFTVLARKNGWVTGALSLSTNVTDYNAGGFAGPAVYRFDDGLVQLVGEISVSGSPPDGKALATLPVGFRPIGAQARTFACSFRSSTFGSNTCSVWVSGTGVVTLMYGAGGTIPGISLSGISFPGA